MSASASPVSIIVPTLNEEANIAPLVAQIIASAVPFREIVFVDEGSTDATRDMIYALAGRCSLRLIEQDGTELGLAGAIMSGARAAHGEILLVMDADFEPSARADQRFAGPVVCRYCGYGCRKPLC